MHSGCKCVSVRVHLWDLSGHDEYIDVRNELYGNTDAVFLVYDITQTSSFGSLDTWMKELKKYASQNPLICLIGSKVFVYGNFVFDTLGVQP